VQCTTDRRPDTAESPGCVRGAFAPAAGRERAVLDQRRRSNRLAVRNLLRALALVEAICAGGCAGHLTSRQGAPVLIDVTAPPPVASNAGLDTLEAANTRPDLEDHLAEKLASGLRVNVVVELEIQGAAGPPRRSTAGSCTVTFDLREEVYRLWIPGAAPNARARVVRSIDAIVRNCTDPQVYLALTTNLAPGTSVRRVARELRDR